MEEKRNETWEAIKKFTAKMQAWLEKLNDIKFYEHKEQLAWVSMFFTHLTEDSMVYVGKTAGKTSLDDSLVEYIIKNITSKVKDLDKKELHNLRVHCVHTTTNYSKHLNSKFSNKLNSTEDLFICLNMMYSGMCKNKNRNWQFDNEENGFLYFICIGDREKKKISNFFNKLCDHANGAKKAGEIHSSSHFEEIEFTEGHAPKKTAKKHALIHKGFITADQRVFKLKLNKDAFSEEILKQTN